MTTIDTVSGHPLYMPHATTFDEILEYHGEWDLSWHTSTVDPEMRGPAAVPVMPRYLPEIAPSASAHERSTWHRDGRNVIGPYCNVRGFDPDRRSIAVRATDATMEALAARIVTPDDAISFEVIRQSTGRTLVLASHSYIIGSIWLAFVDPESVPPYPFARRDERAAGVAAALKDAGHELYRHKAPEPHAIRYSAKDAPELAATIYADGAIERSWPDGTISREPA